MNARFGASRQTRSSWVAALVLLAAFMAVAFVLWRVLPYPRSWLAWLPTGAALLAARALGGGAVLSVRSIAWAGSAFLLCQIVIQLLLATGRVAF